MSFLTWEEDPEESQCLILVWEGVPWRRVDRKLFVKHLRSLSSHTTMASLEEGFYALEEKVAKALAIKWLSHKALFSEELSARLEKKAISKPVRDQVLIFCQHLGALRDAERLEMLVARAIEKGYGPLWIANKWKILQKDWESIFAKYMPQQEEAIRKLVRKRKATDSKQKLIRFLQQRGYRRDQIYSVLSTIQ